MPIKFTQTYIRWSKNRKVLQFLWNSLITNYQNKDRGIQISDTMEADPMEINDREGKIALIQLYVYIYVICAATFL